MCDIWIYLRVQERDRGSTNGLCLCCREQQAGIYRHTMTTTKPRLFHIRDSLRTRYQTGPFTPSCDLRYHGSAQKTRLGCLYLPAKESQTKRTQISPDRKISGYSSSTYQQRIGPQATLDCRSTKSRCYGHASSTSAIALGKSNGMFRTVALTLASVFVACRSSVLGITSASTDKTIAPDTSSWALCGGCATATTLDGQRQEIQF